MELWIGTGASRSKGWKFVVVSCITSFLKKNLELEEHLPYPCVLKSKDNSCVVMIHVDDLERKVLS